MLKQLTVDYMYGTLTESVVSRQWVFLPGLVGTGPHLVLFLGVDALSVCFNTVSTYRSRGNTRQQPHYGHVTPVFTALCVVFLEIPQPFVRG